MQTNTTTSQKWPRSLNLSAIIPPGGPLRLWGPAMRVAPWRWWRRVRPCSPLLPALLCLSVLAPFAPPAAAQTTTTFVKNTGQTSLANTVGSLASDRSQAFTTGSNAAGYKLTSVKIKFKTIVQTGSHNRITVAIYSDSSGSPGSSVGTLTVPTLPNPTDSTVPSGTPSPPAMLTTDSPGDGSSSLTTTVTADAAPSV